MRTNREQWSCQFSNKLFKNLFAKRAVEMLDILVSKCSSWSNHFKIIIIGNQGSQFYNKTAH